MAYFSAASFKFNTASRSLLRYIFFQTLDIFQSIFLIKKLSSVESEGYIQPTSYILFHKHLKVRVPFCIGRSVRGVSFSNNNVKDLYSSLVADVISNKDLKFLSHQLYSNYRQYSSLSAADVVKLPSNKILSRYPAWALVLPWENQDIECKFQGYINSFVSNRSAHGFKAPGNFLQNKINETLYSFSGAYSQLTQTSKLYQSFKKRGIIKSINLPIIDILIHNSRWRWIMSCSGNHRSYIMFSMGYDIFESRVGSVVHRHNLKNCLNVRNGTYTTAEAEYIFDLVFEGKTLIRGLV